MIALGFWRPLSMTGLLVTAVQLVACLQTEGSGSGSAADGAIGTPGDKRDPTSMRSDANGLPTAHPVSLDQPSGRDAAVQATPASDAGSAADEPADAGKQADAGERADAGEQTDAAVGVIVGTWRDAPEGLAAAPRELCSQRWNVQAPSMSRDRAGATFGDIAVDAQGNLLITGTLAASQSFGSVRVDVPWNGTTDARTATLLLKLDPACRPLWGRALLPATYDAAPQLLRIPMAIALDTHQNIVLATWSAQVAGSGPKAGYTSSKLELTLLSADGSDISQTVYPYGDPNAQQVALGDAGEALLSGSRLAVEDYGQGSATQADKGSDVIALFGADGSKLRADLVGLPGDNGAGWVLALGSGREIVIAAQESEALQQCYDTTLSPGATLAKVGANGKLVWQQQLHPPTLSHGLAGGLGAVLGTATDGSIFLLQTWAPDAVTARQASIDKYDANGVLQWQVPTVYGTDSYLRHVAAAPGGRTLAVAGALANDSQIGNTTIAATASGDVLPAPSVVVQLDAVGAVRWATVLRAASDEITTLVETPSDEVVVLGNGASETQLQVFVRKLGT